MRYTQLGFVTYSPKRRSLIKQAEFLLRELVAGRVHEFPCDCGACIYWAYRHRKKGEGRSFSARTFFMHFLRADLMMAAWIEPLPLRHGRSLIGGPAPGSFVSPWRENRSRRLGALAKKARQEAAFAGSPDDELGPPIFATDIDASRRLRVARQKTLTMLRGLEKLPRTRTERMFLRGILNKKSFYTYYNRAGDERLDRIVGAERRELMNIKERQNPQGLCGGPGNLTQRSQL